tara:strand:- start:817 stop:1710 length:894 start_codon:yes stop_codon:yes gene_type:complete
MLTPAPLQQIAIIAAEIGWGSGRASAEHGPELLLSAGLAERLQAKQITRIAPELSMQNGPIPTNQIESVIMNHAKRVSDTVYEAVNKGMFPVVIGGDHTSALGFHTGLARAFGQTGIVWIDTHPDLNTFETSPSGNIHGMVLAGLLGKGSPQMLETTKLCKTLEDHVAMVGIRDADPGEQRWIDEGTINCMTMDTVNVRGLQPCLAEAVCTANQAKAGYGLTIDIDVIDPTQAPFVATPVANGVDSNQLANALVQLPHKDRLLGMEVIEFTPRSNDDAEIACNLVVSMVTAATGAPV